MGNDSVFWSQTPRTKTLTLLSGRLLGEALNRALCASVSSSSWKVIAETWSLYHLKSSISFSFAIVPVNSFTPQMGVWPNGQEQRRHLLPPRRGFHRYGTFSPALSWSAPHSETIDISNKAVLQCWLRMLLEQIQDELVVLRRSRNTVIPWVENSNSLDHL